MTLMRGQRSYTWGVILAFLFIVLAVRFFPWRDLHEHYILAGFYYIRTPVALPRENCTESLRMIHKLQETLAHIPVSSLSKIIHQTWKTPLLPSRYQQWQASWRRCFPTWNHILWSDRDNRCLVQELFPAFLAHYDSLPGNIYRVDSVRYLYLLSFGGIYTDLDTECLKPFDHLLTEEIEVAFGSMDTSGSYPPDYVQNSFMISRAPNHSLWRQAIDSITNKRHLGRPESMTGPHMLMEVIDEYVNQHVGQHDVRIFPSHYFNPFSWSTNQYPDDCKDLNQMTDEEIVKCRAHFLNTSYVIQYHTQSWFKGAI